MPVLIGLPARAPAALPSEVSHGMAFGQFEHVLIKFANLNFPGANFQALLTEQVKS